MDNIEVGTHVQYKTGEDKKEYFVIDYVPADDSNQYPEEVCILVDFPFYPDRIRQLKIWGKADQFIVVNNL